MKLSKSLVVIAMSMVCPLSFSTPAVADSTVPQGSTVTLSTSGDYDDSDITGDYDNHASDSLLINAFVDKGVPVLNIEQDGKRKEIPIITKLPGVEPSSVIKKRQDKLVSLTQDVVETKNKVAQLETTLPDPAAILPLQAPVTAIEALLKTHLTVLESKEEKALKEEAAKAKIVAAQKAAEEKRIAEEKKKVEEARRIAAENAKKLADAKIAAENKKIADAKAKADAAALELKRKQEEAAKQKALNDAALKEIAAQKLQQDQQKKSSTASPTAQQQAASELDSVENNGSDSSSSTSSYLPSSLPSTVSVTVGDSNSDAYKCKVPSGDSLLKPWVQRVRSRIVAQFGVTNIGGTRPGDDQDHGQGLALDVMVPVSSQLGDTVAQWAIDNVSALNIKYIIWKQRIWAPYRPYWKGMKDRGGVTANHYDHVHISFYTGSGSCPA